MFFSFDHALLTQYARDAETKGVPYGILAWHMLSFSFLFSNDGFIAKLFERLGYSHEWGLIGELC